MNLNQDTKSEHAFYCADGAILKNLRELAEKLKTISADAYGHHANEYKNDFRNWVRDVYGNKRLAEKVASAKSSAEAAKIIEQAIAPKALQKKKTAERKKAAVFKRKRTKKRRKPAKKAAIRKTAAVEATASKRGKKKPTVKIKKRRKTKRKPAKRKIKLHKTIHSHLKRIARQLGFL